MEIFLLLLLAVIILDIAAMRWGVDSREGISKYRFQRY